MMKAIRFITVFSFLLVFGLITGFSQNDFCFLNVSAQTTNETKPTETPQVKPVLVNKPTQRYRIGLQDVLEIQIAKHPELSQAVVKLDSEGKIRLNKIDKLVMAACKTENELASEIQNLYRENYLRDPFVMVNVREQNSQPFSVIGAVKKPGYFVTNRRLTLLELLSYAGGPDIEFAGTKIQVARIGGISGCVDESENVVTDGEIAFFTFNLADVINQKTNPVMKPGDIVVLLEADPVYVTGNVVKPQTILLKQTTTLTQAIAAAGGMLPATKKSQVTLVRQENGTKVEVVYDLKDIRDKKILDPVLQANDIVFVPTDKVKSFLGSLVEALTGGLGNIFTRIPIR